MRSRMFITYAYVRTMTIRLRACAYAGTLCLHRSTKGVHCIMSDQTNVTDATATNANAPETGKPSKPRKPRVTKDSFKVSDLARARLRARGVKSDERLTD